ncbi:PREDICTED: monocarboxylate transporter 14 [Dipodomys ordii]|uniref:Monocarboxylate transporter 14 n=1 Tax=Dipodomys ordii TaxID=10020 RepID=A0A1S3G4F1_DIPOR|nr:PREDICTED: monocarboxylate transporter 14 [Dipodomys ordii]
MYTSHEDVGYDFEDDPKDKKTLKPHPDIDGGWAWMMVLSSFFVHILIMGSQMALGVLNVEWLEEFQQSRGLTAWVSSLSMGITLIVGPFIGLFINTCGCRQTTIVGGLLNSLGWVLSAYAANVQYLFITFGVTAGLGSGMAYLPAVVTVGRYFQKRRALAQGLSTTGTGFGTFLMTALLKYLCSEYGWRNAMFIQGAVSLNLCVCGALMRPLSAGKDGPRPGAQAPRWHAGYFGAASLFTNHVFVAFVFWALFAYSSFVVPFIHLPEIVNLYHLSAQNDVFPLTSIIAIVHIAGKVVLGAVADLPGVRVWTVFLLANLTLGLSIFLLPLLRTYAGLAVICALIGFSSGYFSLMPVVTEDLVGIRHLANAYGIIICANGISALLGPPFAGWIYDITQKYDFSFYICGLLYMIGILFLLIQPCIRIIEQSRRKHIDNAHV